MSNGVYSQKQLTSSPTTRVITSIERDSIYIKLQRGKINAEKVSVLRKSLQECGATKAVYVKVIKTQNMKADSLRLIILKQRDIENNLIAINEEQIKSSRKKANKALFKGTIIGVILTIVVDQILHLAKR
jgi:hypothetical protein